MGYPFPVDPFAALADPVRRGILRQLAAGPARVVDLAAGHPVSRPAVSRHLRVLAAAGLVDADDRGRERHYRLERGPLGEVRALLDELGTAGSTRPTGPPVTPDVLDALETEVRRTGRDRRRERSPDGTRDREAG